MRLHVVSVPHTETTRDYEWCAFTSETRKFANMMHSLGHEVYLYAGEHNEGACTEHIDCSDPEFDERLPPYESDYPMWRAFADKAIAAIAEREQSNDYLCLIGGLVQKPVADAFAAMTTVEFGVGYEGVFSRFRVFVSYAWMHAVYGWSMGANRADGSFYDAVIPCSLEVEDFPAGEGKGDYLLYVGRLIERKGLAVVRDVAERTGLPLVIAGGDGDESLIPPDAEYHGIVGPDERAKLMGNARCILAPTLYVEPFGKVAVEAQMCGTPAITTDWGGFVETVDHRRTGFRCHNLADFCAAVDASKDLDRAAIRERAIKLYSTDTVRHQYQWYFEQLATLRGEGWYS